jgi:aspartyl-tRNA(Asn)/glutamyl-tRNA(Gln) amidotransferase subunit B
MPGSLPVLNRMVVELTLRLAVAVGCTIESQSRFARKSYFYPDLPKGYQISQYELPIARYGHIDIESDAGTKRIGICRIHMEEDAGKLAHDPYRPVSLVDFNRTGVPLIEIVSDPDMRSPEEAGAYLRKLHSLVRFLDICDGNMEEGSLRCDANVSIRPKGRDAFGTRTEVKNLNSFRNLEKAIHYEILRQKESLSEGTAIVQETRLWDPDRGMTLSMRGKEEAHDYRYFPDPDLLPVVVSDAWIAAVKAGICELPDEMRERFVRDYGLPAYDAEILTSSRELAVFFESCLEAFPKPKPVSNWVMGNLLGLLNAAGKSIRESPVSPRSLGELLALVETGAISGKIAKEVLEEMARTGASPGAVIEQKGIVQVSDAATIARLVEGVLARSPKEVSAYREGKTKLFGFFVGQVMQETRGKANPKVVNDILREKLEKK